MEFRYFKSRVFEFIDYFLSKRLSDCEGRSAEGAVLNHVTQSIRRFGQRKGFGDDRHDRAGLK
jgi:hypothetical protein